MKITIAYQANNIITGLAAGMSAISKIETTIFLPEQKPIYDVFEEKKPDLFICPFNIMNDTFKGAVKEYDIDTVVIGGGDYELSQIKLACIDSNTAPKIQENIINNNPDTPLFFMRPAANLAQFNRGQYNAHYASDIFYLSNDDQFPYLDMLNLLIEQYKYKIKIAGAQNIPYAQYIGVPNVKEISSLLRSAQIVMGFSEQIRLDCAANKAFCIAPGENNINWDSNRSKKEDDKILEIIDHFLEDDNHRDYFIKKAYNKVMAEDTYFHRIARIFEVLHMGELVQGSLDTLLKLQNDKLKNDKGN